MTTSLNAFVAWPNGHRDIFEQFLKRMLSNTEKFSSAKGAVGKYVRELLHQQAARLEAAKNERGPAFDTRGESIELVMSLYDNLKHLEKRGAAYTAVLASPDSQLDEFRDEKKHPWLTRAGCDMLRRAWELGNTARVSHSALPLRVGAQRTVTLLTLSVLREIPSEDALKFALSATWEGYWNYYRDYRILIETHGPRFLEAMKPIQDALRLIEAGMAENAARAEAQRIAADEEEHRRAAEEAEEEDRRARQESADELQSQRGDSESDTHQPSGHAEPETYQPSSYDNSNDYFADYNPATGMPTTSPYGADVMGNTYGTDDHMY